MYIWKVIATSYRILGRHGAKAFNGLQCFYLISALIQVFGIASIGPFIAILSKPELIHSNALLAYLHEQLGFSSTTQFMTASAFASIGLILLSNFIAGTTYFLSFRFSVHIGNRLQNELLANLLRRPYLFHRTTDHTAAIAAVNQELPRFVFMVLQPLLILLSQGLVAAVILLGLLALDPVIALSAGALIGGSYLVTYALLSQAMRKRGQIISAKNAGVQSILTEAFASAKEIKLRGNEGYYVDRFQTCNRRGLAATSFVSLAGELPKLIIESISFASLLLLAVWLLSSDVNPGSIVGLLSLCAVAGYKLLPTTQQIYRSLANLGAHGQVALNLAAQLAQAVESVGTAGEPAAEVNEIQLDSVSFVYPGRPSPALHAVTVQFHRGMLNTIAGPSGSGKSTLADIALGLLQPTTGQLLFNGTPVVAEQLGAYRATIAYVAQQVFIANDTVVANVALGVAPSQIDRRRVDFALQLANATQFVVALPNGSDSVLGQDGKLLSGGQRQRIGIARALYQNAKILVLDEPTSALDLASERELMKTLQALKDQLLTIIISHRPAAIEASDYIVLLEQGTIVSAGPVDRHGAILDELSKLAENRSHGD